jgi:hypothetical protein
MSKPGIKTMSPEQLREYRRNAKKDQRARASEEREAKRIPDAEELLGRRLPETKQKPLDDCVKNFVETVRVELNYKPLVADLYVLEATANCLHGLENGILRKVYVGTTLAMHAGNHFPDAVASTTIEHVHRFPKLLESPTFKNLYDKFLRAVIAWDGKYQHRYSTPEFIAEVKAELAGTYTLPIQISKPEKAPVRPTPATIKQNDSAAEQRTLQQIRDRNLDPTALRYLVDGQ